MMMIIILIIMIIIIMYVCGGWGWGCILFGGGEMEIYKGPLQTQTIHYLTLIQSG